MLNVTAAAAPTTRAISPAAPPASAQPWDNVPVFDTTSKFGNQQINDTIYGGSLDLQLVATGTSLSDATTAAAALAATVEGQTPQTFSIDDVTSAAPKPATAEATDDSGYHAIGAVLQDASSGAYWIGATGLGMKLGSTVTEAPLGYRPEVPGVITVVHPDGSAVPRMDDIVPVPPVV